MPNPVPAMASSMGDLYPFTPTAHYVSVVT
jgi:hypothetical protein